MYASKSGLDLMKTVDTISLGAASSTSLSIMGKRIINQDYNPGFYVEHYIKDM
jgi:3-hydroxyisobutyrate dehydrogenase